MRKGISFVVALLTACGSGADQSSRETALERYIDAVNRNAVSDALALHTPDAEFVIPGQNPIQGMDAMRSLLQWDSVLDSRIHFAPLEWRGDTLVMSAGAERNAWFSGIGLDSIQYSWGTRIVFERGLIRGIYPSALARESLAELEGKLRAFWVWAEANAPEVAQLAPEGLFQYDATAAERWLDILARYREGVRR